MVHWIEFSRMMYEHFVVQPRMSPHGFQFVHTQGFSKEKHRESILLKYHLTCLMTKISIVSFFIPFYFIQNHLSKHMFCWKKLRNILRFILFTVRKNSMKKCTQNCIRNDILLNQKPSLAHKFSISLNQLMNSKSLQVFYPIQDNPKHLNYCNKIW